MKGSPKQLIESRSAECVVFGVGTSCEITYSNPTDNSAALYDFKLPHAIARFTWWSDTSYFSESLALDGRQIVSTQGFAADASSAVKAVNELLAATENAHAT